MLLIKAFRHNKDETYCREIKWYEIIKNGTFATVIIDKDIEFTTAHQQRIIIENAEGRTIENISVFITDPLTNPKGKFSMRGTYYEDCALSPQMTQDLVDRFYK